MKTKFHQGITYWNHNGKHQKQYELMYEELVPKRGTADTVSGELMRSMVNLYYDVYNNGGCNIKYCYKTEVNLIKEALGRKTLPAHSNFEGWEKIVNDVIELVAKTFKSGKGQLITAAEASEINNMGGKIHKSLRDINEIVVPANYNSPGQNLISGSEPGIDLAVAQLT